MDTDSTTLAQPGSVAAAPPVPMRFVGSGGEYFRIWIVNILLTIVTLGIYSAWATVRNRRYLYGNTDLDGHVFDFHGKPTTILKGRLIALVVLLAIYFGEFLHIMISLLVPLALILAFPWILVMTLRFRLSNTSHRGLRFGFDATVGQAYRRLLPVLLLGTMVIAYMLLGLDWLIPMVVGDDTEQQLTVFFSGYLIAMVVALLIVPMFAHRVRDLMVNGCRYGQHRFRADLRLSKFWGVFGMTLLSGLVAGILAGIAVTALVFSTIDPSELEALPADSQSELVQSDPGTADSGFQQSPAPAEELSPEHARLLTQVFLMYLLVIPLYMFPFAVWRCGVLNYSYSATRIEDVRPTLKLNPWRYWGIMVTNGVVVLATIGLAIPWAKVRMMRYQLSCMSVAGELDQFIAGARRYTGATGEELGNVFDFELGF